MQYYNQTDYNEVRAMERELLGNGFKVSISHSTCEILRETSKYNKYMKWHVVTKSEACGLIASEYFKTKPEALRRINKPCQPMPIGDRLTLSYIELKDKQEVVKINYRQMRRWQKAHPRDCGFSTLAEPERRATPWLGGYWYAPGREKERAAFIKEWDIETERLLSKNPKLIIVGSRPGFTGLKR